MKRKYKVCPECDVEGVTGGMHDVAMTPDEYDEWYEGALNDYLSALRREYRERLEYLSECRAEYGAWG